MRLLLVDDDAALRALLSATFGVFDIEVIEAASAVEAESRIRESRPEVIVLDVVMPGTTGLELCRKLKAEESTRSIPVVLLTGSNGGTSVAADEAGADALVLKPFSPLELLAVVERVAGGLYGIPFRSEKPRDEQEQLVLYARDLRYLLELERGQRALLQDAYRQTVLALATALESKDLGTNAHSQRVRHYAVELTRTAAPELELDPGLEYGFLLHDVGKIAIPDNILQKPGPLTAPEKRLIRKHTIVGEQMLGGIAFLHQGECLRVVRSHHERWNGLGYPDRLRGDEIPLGARVFAVADTLDAMTSKRPYRRPARWEEAVAEVEAQAGRQFDPEVVEAFRDCAPRLREIQRELAAVA